MGKYIGTYKKDKSLLSEVKESNRDKIKYIGKNPKGQYVCFLKFKRLNNGKQLCICNTIEELNSFVENSYYFNHYYDFVKNLDKKNMNELIANGDIDPSLVHFEQGNSNDDVKDIFSLTGNIIKYSFLTIIALISLPLIAFSAHEDTRNTRIYYRDWKGNMHWR